MAMLARDAETPSSRSLRAYVAQSNGAMEDTVRERPRTNPEFGFLFGGAARVATTRLTARRSQRDADWAHFGAGVHLDVAAIAEAAAPDDGGYVLANLSSTKGGGTREPR